jgi:hypothetical protein
VRYLEMFSFPDVYWYVLHDGEYGKTSLFRAARYDEEESMQALYKIQEGLAATDEHMALLTSKSTTPLSPSKLYRAGLS